jgi:hypothetical protein
MEEFMASKYSKAAQKEVEKEMRRYKKGKAHSGPKLKKVKSRKQAIAIGLSKARKKGDKVPKKAKSKAKPRVKAKKSK